MSNYRQAAETVVTVHLNLAGDSAAADSAAIHQYALNYVRKGTLAGEKTSLKIVVPFETWERLCMSRHVAQPGDCSEQEILQRQLTPLNAQIIGDTPYDAVLEERFSLLIHRDLAEKYLELQQRVEDLEGALKTARETSTEPQWIVNDSAELGVLVNGRAWFLYKGKSFEYGDGKHDDGTDILFRHVGKREFGECCEPVARTTDRAKAAHVPAIRARLLSQSDDCYLKGDGWRPLKVLTGDDRA